MFDYLSNIATDAKQPILDGLRHAAAGGVKAKEWAMANPRQATAIGAGTALVVAPMAVAAPVLGLVGFGSLGPVAGSAAVAAQSGMGSVVAPSLFATLQSAAMGGYGVAAVAGTVQGAGGLIASSAGASAIYQKIMKMGKK
ncbi:hypothetical protein F5Y16DRAFT_369867 [Xylariaceae sp. FL0255]|nr:hypothetical protein F5Y16DRAFT_369867 [Xylariaceae sp. FL0255]